MMFFLGAALLGMVLGVFYYGGLWLTVKRIMKAELVPLLFALSFFLRTGLTLLGFYQVMAGSWQRLLSAFAGFMLARVLLSNWLGKNMPMVKPLLQSVNHET